MSLSSSEIRFKDDNGNDFPDWEEKKLGELGDFKSGVGFSESEQGGKVGTPFYKVSDMNLAGNESSMNSANHYVSDAQISANKYKVIADVSLVFAKVGAAIFLERKRVASNFLIDNNMMAFIPSFDISFAQHLFTTIRLSRFAQVGALPSYNASDLRTIKVSIPHPAEQKKIADFLTSVDERIGQLIKKKALLEDYKKGVMQQLFSQQIRFKDDNGNDFPDWEEKKLGDLCDITTGKLDANAMSLDGQYRFYTCAKEYLMIDNYAFDTEALLISGNGANVGYIHYYQGKFNAYQRTYVLDGFTDAINFIQYQLEVTLKKRIQLESKAGNIPYIVMDTLAGMRLSLPTLPEQKKIADFLTSVDQKIESVSQQIAKTQTFKKGLLQQMFV